MMGNFRKLVENAHRTAAVLDTLNVRNGRLMRSAQGPWCLECSASGTYNRIFVGGVKMTIPAYPETDATDKWCINIPFDGSALTWVDWDMDDPQPANARIIDPDYTYGDVHIDRAP